MSEWYHQIKWYSKEALELMITSSVKDHVNRVLTKVIVVFDKAVVGFSETRKLETLLGTLNGSGLDGVEDVLCKTEQVKGALDESMALINQLEVSALQLYDEMKAKEAEEEQEDESE